MTTLLLTHPVFLDHDTGHGHPERPDRLRAVDKAMSSDAFTSLVRAEAPLRDDIEEQICLAHDSGYFAAVRDATPSPGELVHLDPDTVMSHGSWEAALRAVGAGLYAVDEIMSDTSAVTNAFCAVRPPGHHAESSRVTGFCLFSNAAITALYARKAYGMDRVAVVDFDVHHGNGTQEIFWSDRDLFFGSTHQMPLYPGTGSLSESGVGNIFNAPLRSGDGSEAFKAALQSRILPALANFAPDLIVVSAGFDGHRDDPLAGLRLVEQDYAWVTEQLLEIAERHSRGRMVSMLEGGYDLRALAGSVAAHVGVLMQA